MAQKLSSRNTSNTHESALAALHSLNRTLLPHNCALIGTIYWRKNWAVSKSETSKPHSLTQTGSKRTTDSLIYFLDQYFQRTRRLALKTQLSQENSELPKWCATNDAQHWENMAILKLAISKPNAEPWIHPKPATYTLKNFYEDHFQYTRKLQSKIYLLHKNTLLAL